MTLMDPTLGPSAATPLPGSVDPIDTLTPFEANTDTSGRVHRVSPEMAAYIVRIKRLRPQITQKEIAALCGVSQPTVSNWLAALDNDTVKEARQHVKSQALRASMKLSEQVDSSDPRVSQGAAKAIAALAGVQEGSAQVTVGVQVIVGSQDAPAGHDPLDNMTIDASPVTPTE
jgi:predicted transcriptional regulator